MNILYITGSHSSGKSILVQSLKEYPGIILCTRQCRNELFNNQEYELLAKDQSQKVKVLENLSTRLNVSLYDETKRQIALAEEHLSDIIIADHFLLDCMAYIMACFDLGWLTKIGLDVDALKKRL